MPRFMTIWLPRWPVQRRLLDRPELRKVPVFVCRRERRGAMTVVSWAWAEPPRFAGQATGARGGSRAIIPPGMSLAEAMAVLAAAHGSRACHIAEVEPDDSAADRAAIEQVARWCRRFSPTVGIEAVAGTATATAGAPECIHLDVTGTAGFFGGEASLVRTAVWTFAARGLHARAAVADTCSAAWAAAHHTDMLAPPGAVGTTVAVVPQRHAADPAGGVRRTAVRRRRRWAMVPKGEAAALLAGLPVSALRLDIATISLLGEVGIDSIGGALRLTGKSLAARFPPLLSRRLAEFRGTVAEPITPPGGESLPQESCAFDFPLRAADVHEELLIETIAPLIDRCLTPLASRGTGVLSLQVRLEHGSRLASAAPTVIDVGLFRPSVSRPHLVELVRLRLARMRLPAEIDGIAVEVVAAGPVACRQRTLFGPVEGADNSFEAANADVEVGMLLDRLSGRLGRPAVFEPQLVGDAQPEHAWIAAPPRNDTGPPRNDKGRPGNHTPPRRDRGGRVGTSAPRGDAFLRHTPAGRRPIWMPPRPLPLESIEFEMVSIAADGPPVRFRLGDRMHRIVQAHGPERIETAWWRGPSVRRDYYVVETESGERFWVFRRLRDGSWFFHGMFA